MKTNHSQILALALILLLPLAPQLGGIWGCGSSSTQAGTGDDTGDDSGATGTTVEVTDLSTLPSLDLSAADTTASLSLPPALAMKNASIGDTSASGCVATQFFKPLALKRLQEAELFKCYVAHTQDCTNSDSDPANDISVTTDEYGYFQVALPEETVRARLGNFVTDSTNTFKMDVCFSGDGGTTYARENELSITGNTDDLTWSGFVTEHFSGGGEGGVAFTNSSFSILMASAEAMSEEFDIANVSTIDTTNYFGRNPTTDDVEDATSYDDVFRLSFTYDGAAVENSVTGSFSETSGLADGIMYARFNAAEGASQMTFNQNRSEVFSDSEAFDPSVSPPTVVDSGSVSFYDEVAAFDLPDSVTVADVNGSVAFTTDWDCTAPEGSSFTEVDGTSCDYTDCDALADEVMQEDSADNSECFGDEEGGDEGGTIDLSGSYLVSNSVAGDGCPSNGATLTATSSGENSYSVTSSEEGTATLTVTGETSCIFDGGDGGICPCSLQLQTGGGAGSAATIGSCGGCGWTMTKQ